MTDTKTIMSLLKPTLSEDGTLYQEVHAAVEAYHAQLIDECVGICEWMAENGVKSWHEPRMGCADEIRKLKK